ncbi:hypothetical protein FBU30_000303 [Linnemannia zychae]|nr:hypothetical protein FBU30_000303 [Linnemannia zychae]
MTTAVIAPRQGFITQSHSTSKDTVAITRQLITLGIQSNLHIQTVASCLQGSWPYSSPPGPGAASFNPDEKIFSMANMSLVPSDTGVPPSGHVDYDDYYTMEGQLLNRLIAQAKASRPAQSKSSAKDSSMLRLYPGGKKWLWIIVGIIVDHRILLQMYS